MSTVAADRIHVATGNPYAGAIVSEQTSIALLGFGQVGRAVAAAISAAGNATPFRIAGALVRDASRARTVRTRDRIRITTSPDALLDASPGVVVEALGGIEPARTLVLEALMRGIPVVTANKALLAAQGDELFAAAAASGSPLRYEATVIAGVPFLGAFGRRPLASRINAVTGIVNGTSNFILSAMANDGLAYGDALRAAQSRGLAEPDPSRDVRGLDSTDKLCILLRHFGQWSVRPGDMETSGIESITVADLRHARAFDGVIKPLVRASWSDRSLAAFAGPAFVPAAHPLASVHGLNNGIALTGGPAGDLFYSGPGAGPAVTAATILDDVAEAIEQPRRQSRPQPAWRSTPPDAPETGWFVRLSAPVLPPGPEVADLLAAHGVWSKRTSDTCSSGGRDARWLLTYPCARARVEHALAALASACECETTPIRALEA